MFQIIGIGNPLRPLALRWLAWRIQPPNEFLEALSGSEAAKYLDLEGADLRAARKWWRARFRQSVATHSRVGSAKIGRWIFLEHQNDVIVPYWVNTIYWWYSYQFFF